MAWAAWRACANIAPMTVLLRSLIVWLMLLAIPYQGVASATMMLCVDAGSTHSADSVHSAHSVKPAHQAHTAPAAAAMPAAHDHAAMLQGGHDGHGKSTHDGMKCSGASCCAAGAPASIPMLALLAPITSSQAVAGYADFLPAVHLAHPERPPQGRRA